MKRRVPPLPPPGEAPSPLGLCRALRPASSFSSFSSRRPLLTKPSFPAAPVGPRAASAQSAAPPAPLLLPAATEGGLLGLAAPTLGASHMGRRLTAWLLRSLAGFLFFFLFLLFSSSSFFPLPSPRLSFPLAFEGGGRERDYFFFPRRKDLGAPEATDRR